MWQYIYVHSKWIWMRHNLRWVTTNELTSSYFILCVWNVACAFFSACTKFFDENSSDELKCVEIGKHTNQPTSQTKTNKPKTKQIYTFKKKLNGKEREGKRMRLLADSSLKYNIDHTNLMICLSYIYCSFVKMWAKDMIYREKESENGRQRWRD